MQFISDPSRCDRNSNGIDPNSALFCPFGAGGTAEEVFLDRGHSGSSTTQVVALKIVVANMFWLHAS
jgi:hypothetical protein